MRLFRASQFSMFISDKNQNYKPGTGQISCIT